MLEAFWEAKTSKFNFWNWGFLIKFSELRKLSPKKMKVLLKAETTKKILPLSQLVSKASFSRLD